MSRTLGAVIRPSRLQPFAAATGLDYAGPAIEAGFLSTLPVWSEYNFNVCRGEFPGGRLGRLGHELREMSASEGSIRDGGTFYDVRVTTHRSARDMLNLGDGDPQNAPFAGNAVWIPTTTIHLRIPEVNQLPVLTISRTGEVVFGGSKLDRFGLAGYRLAGYRLKRGPPSRSTVIDITATTSAHSSGLRPTPPKDWPRSPSRRRTPSSGCPGRGSEPNPSPRES